VKSPIDYNAMLVTFVMPGLLNTAQRHDKCLKCSCRHFAKAPFSMSLHCNVVIIMTMTVSKDGLPKCRFYQICRNSSNSAAVDAPSITTQYRWHLSPQKVRLINLNLEIPCIKLLRTWPFCQSDPIQNPVGVFKIWQDWTLLKWDNGLWTGLSRSNNVWSWPILLKQHIIPLKSSSKSGLNNI